MFSDDDFDSDAESAGVSEAALEELVGMFRGTRSEDGERSSADVDSARLRSNVVVWPPSFGVNSSSLCESNWRWAEAGGDLTRRCLEEGRPPLLWTTSIGALDAGCCCAGGGPGPVSMLLGSLVACIVVEVCGFWVKHCNISLYT